MHLRCEMIVNFSDIAIAKLNFSLLFFIQLSLNNFALLFVLVLYIGCWFLFCIAPNYSYRSSNYCDSNSYHSFRLRQQRKEKEISSQSPQRVSNNFTRSSQEKKQRSETKQKIHRQQQRKVQYCYRQLYITLNCPLPQAAGAWDFLCIPIVNNFGTFGRIKP